jgi:hypothetical protein
MDRTEKEPQETTKKRYHFLNKRVGIYAVITAVAIVVLFGGWNGYLYATTPEHIRKPTFQHYHFRTQIVVDGNAVDFQKMNFKRKRLYLQLAVLLLAVLPIDFHDKMDQLTHVHWNGMTGGEFLKYFGWNYIGGEDELLGRRYDAGSIIPSSVKDIWQGACFNRTR